LAIAARHPSVELLLLLALVVVRYRTGIITGLAAPAVVVVGDAVVRGGAAATVTQASRN